ncbi:type II secretion system F family protein [Adhaeribacter soli]|uniref:General secretion pathway protein F n=1 Tax=Adhaeribacter soli TaxID=2607655 RepID=A0A5N1IID9_9BACT|nr:type II secretion system F family protein [Adhaeribacter soli]KAA9324906.1 type II secretion system F family protein [Adhaeribacter soli]
MSGLNLKEYKIGKNRKGAEAKPISIDSPVIRTPKAALKLKEKESFYSELQVLLLAGIDLKAALELIEGQQKNSKLRLVFREIKENLINGSSLSAALKASGCFSAYESFSIEIGEESGKLPDVLIDIAKFYNRSLKQRRQIIQALSYPVIVIIASIAAVGFMLNVIVPMFADIFKQFGGQLPGPTQFVISVSKLIQGSFLPVFFSILFVSIYSYFSRKKAWFRKYSSNFLSKVPIIGNLINLTYLARLCSALGLLTSSKVPLIQAVQLARQMVDYYPIETSLRQVEEDILFGKTLYESLAAYSIYNSRMLSFIRIGEEANKLDHFFYKLSIQFSEEIEHETSLLSSIMEPAIIIVLGLFVGIILISMYLPLFNLSSHIG